MASYDGTNSGLHSTLDRCQGELFDLELTAAWCFIRGRNYPCCRATECTQSVLTNARTIPLANSVGQCEYIPNLQRLQLGERALSVYSSCLLPICNLLQSVLINALGSLHLPSVFINVRKCNLVSVLVSDFESILENPPIS